MISEIYEQDNTPAFFLWGKAWWLESLEDVIALLRDVGGLDEDSELDDLKECLAHHGEWQSWDGDIEVGWHGDDEFRIELSLGGGL
jgi:hypothetical protein